MSITLPPLDMSASPTSVVHLTPAEWWQRFETYFFSVFENSLFELAVFVAAALLFFVLRHQWQNWRMHRARQAIPLVIGGWGTRGKSGTERIKAALFNALGYSVVSKTTGCEAMFLHGHVFDELREMFLFRPYDKATIWEQKNVVELAQRLGGEVFLWECMALTPSFVQLLQRRWMRDDIATLTNTFPDHEDLQGPAGIDIPQVMTNFIPERGRLLTSEEQMRPILQSAADRLGTRLSGVGWLESGLLAPDVLARFPYQEHPDNIALVTRLAAELGIPSDFALKEMADRVVPDLGVLKTYPTAQVNHRQLSFANGMSANERFGCLGNWKRLAFDRTPPEVFVTTVVNNRADRVARSRVFAGVLVEDIGADMHVLIGGNLAGMQGYIRESWAVYAQGLTLWPAGRQEAPLEVLAGLAQRFRIPHTPELVASQLKAMLDGQGLAAKADELLALQSDPEAIKAALHAAGCPAPDATLAHLARAQTRLAQCEALRKQVLSGASREGVDAALREQLWQWFEQKLLVVEDYHATGDQIIALIAEHTPPGFDNRVMGIQNIKGTGLDFIYRWQAWDVCHRLCTELLSSQSTVAQRGLSGLASFREYGLLCEEKMRATLQQAKHSPVLQLERQQATLEMIAKAFDTSMAEMRQGLQSQRTASRTERWLAHIEGFFDAGDAVKRRRTANRIYDDLVSQRISHARAAIELQKLNKRQKGGWLYADLRSHLTPLAKYFAKA